MVIEARPKYLGIFEGKPERVPSDTRITLNHKNYLRTQITTYLDVITPDQVILGSYENGVDYLGTQKTWWGRGTTYSKDKINDMNIKKQGFLKTITYTFKTSHGYN